MTLNLILGIDFGTTNSCVSYYNHDFKKIQVVLNENGQDITPTSIYFDPDSEDVYIGETALQFKQNVITDFKRLVGVKHKDYIKNKSLIDFFNKKNITIIKDPNSEFCAVLSLHNSVDLILTIPELTQLFLKKWLIDNPLLCTKDQKKAVITVPAYFNNTQRNIIKNAYEKNGIDVLRIINEPTASVLNVRDTNNYFLDEYVLVIDCGGGTTDISLLQIDYQEKIYEVVTTHGDNFLGGEDITIELMNYFLEKLSKNIPINKLNTTRIKKQAERIKKELSYNQNAIFYYEQDDTPLSYELSRTQFINRICNTFFKTIEKLIWDTVVGYVSKINKVVLVGGTTRIPHFQNICKRIIGEHIQIEQKLNPDVAISSGACIQAINLVDDVIEQNNADELTLIDILPFSVGIEIEGGFMSTLISKNSKLPMCKTKIFTNSEDYISSMDIDIYQGERKFVSDNEKLATIILNNLDKTLKRGEMKIQVKFEIDVNGIINVSVLDDKTKSKNQIDITLDVVGPSEVDTKGLSTDTNGLSTDTKRSEDTDSEDDIFVDSLRTQIVLKKLEIQRLLKMAIEGSELIKRKNTDSLAYNKLQILLNIVSKFIDYCECQEEYNYKFLQKVQKFYEQFRNEWHTLMINL